MRLGFIQVYNEVNWIGFAIDQAMRLCDRVLIAEGSQFADFPDISERSDDGTLDIISDKQRQYPGVIRVFGTTRKHRLYRRNQCDNFNYALSLCDIGDYFLLLDADEFYPDEWIDTANELMAKNRVDIIRALSRYFVFSFNWLARFGPDQPRDIIVKRVPGLSFVPTHKCSNAGGNAVTIPEIGRFHYMWVKPAERVLMRMRTSGRYAGMVKWFEKNWCNITLEEGKTYQSYNKTFTLHRYKGDHPSILDGHPWRHVEDIRRLGI